MDTYASALFKLIEEQLDASPDATSNIIVARMACYIIATVVSWSTYHIFSKLLALES